METSWTPTHEDSSPPPVAPHPTPPEAWSQRLLAKDASGFLGEGRRLLVAASLAAAFGAAIGLRVSLPSSAMHAAGVVLGVAAVCLLAVPALGILLALFDASLEAVDLAQATSRAAATGGLVLAGLTPAAILFAVTVEDALTVTFISLGGLALAGALAIRAFVSALSPHLVASAQGRFLARVAVPLFVAFATVLATRIWWVSLPLMRGVS